MTGINKILRSYPVILLSFFIFYNSSLLAQCTNGTQPECACETAPVLCTIDELDGYTFSMTSFQHPDDGPTPICPGAGLTQTNNPTWFAFTAWCTNLTLRVHSTNCHSVGGFIGFQLAIYTNCNFNHVVACNADANDCNTNDKILNLTGLNIGTIYYFMVDGCLGSYCTVSIDVVGVCGQEHIAPWTLPVSGNGNPCAGDSETYSVENLDGARFYHWFIDGVLVAKTNTNTFSTQWPDPGTYQLCIDASNDPCVDVSDPPLPLCTTITVHEVNAGILNITPLILCTNEVAQISNTGFTSGIGNGQFIIITDATGLILEVRTGGTANLISDSAGIFIIYAYNYLFPGGTIPVTGGNINDIDCNSRCCDLVSQTITFQRIEATLSGILCDNNETGNDSTDDTFTFDLLVTGSFVDTIWQSTDGTISGTYGKVQKYGPYPIDAGVLTFDIQDHDDLACVTTIVVNPPHACSSCLQTIDAGMGSTLNCVNTALTLTGTSSETGTYQWSGPNLFSSDSLITIASDSGWYYLNISFSNQCVASDSVFVGLDNDAPVANAGDDQILDCNHSEVLIDGSGSTGAHLGYVWTNIQGDIISTQTLLLVDSVGIYILRLTNSVSGCTSIDSAQVFIDQNELGYVSVIVSPENCIGDNNGMLQLTGISAGIPPYTYDLNGMTGDSTGLFDHLAPGEYNLLITDANGCEIDTFFTINPGIDLELTLPENIQLHENQTGLIHATVNVPVADLNSIQWSPSGILSCDTCLSTIIKAHDNQSLQLIVIHINGCVDTANLILTVFPTPNIYIPNTFSPNGDGLNDLFTINSNGGVESILEFNIFDRWGDHIYQANNISPNSPGFGWDGKFHHWEMPSGTFVYYIKVLLSDGTVKKMTGDVTLVK